MYQLITVFHTSKLSAKLVRAITFGFTEIGRILRLLLAASDYITLPSLTQALNYLSSQDTGLSGQLCALCEAEASVRQVPILNSLNENPNLAGKSSGGGPGRKAGVKLETDFMAVISRADPFDLVCRICGCRCLPTAPNLTPPGAF